MKKRELHNLGIPNGEAVRVAIEAIRESAQSGMSRQSMRTTIKNIIDHPEGHINDPIFGELAWNEGDPGGFYFASAHELAWGEAPLFVGIAGGSASGKSTIADEIARRLAPLAVEIINQDRFFKPRDELPTYHSDIYGEPRPAYNRPDCYRVPEMFESCRAAARDGAADVVILEGILVLHFPELRELMDLAIYVEADADERIIRRTGRNMAKWSFDEITHYYLESVRWDHRLYNAPTKEHADIVIPGGMADAAERDGMLEGLCGAIREWEERGAGAG